MAHARPGGLPDSPGYPGAAVSRVLPVLRLAVALTLVVLVLRGVDPGEAAARMREAPWWGYAAPWAILLVNGGVHALRLGVLLPEPRPPWSEVLRSVLVGNFFGLFLPTGGGDVAKVVALGRTTGRFEEAVAALLLSRLLELVPWGLLLIWGAAGVLPGRLPAMEALAWVTAAGMGGVLGLAAAAWRLGPGRRPTLPGWAEARVRRLEGFRTTPARLAACLGLTFPFALLNCLAAWTVLRAYGVGLSFPVVMGLVPTLDVLIALPVTVSGVGVREGVFVHGLAAWGVAAPTALAVALTRWTGELFRAALGGLWWAAGRRGPA